MTSLSYAVSALLAVTLGGLLTFGLYEAYHAHLRGLDRLRGRR